jgi:hypothetical protein
MCLIDVVTTYLYESLDNDIYMKIPEGYKMTEAYNYKSRSIYSIKLPRSLYRLKQSRRMWYNRLSEYLLKEEFENNPICSCVAIKKSKSGFAIIVVYVDDLNIVGTPKELTKTATYLKNKFEMKDLGKTIHRSTYTKKVLKYFYMEKAYHLSTPMVVQSLDVQKYHFSLLRR